MTGGFTTKFLTSSLEHQSSAALAAHLVNPLLGVCSSLLALLRDSSGSDDALLKRIESAIDSSGTAERMDEGRATKRFMSVGGPALLQRWTQRSVGAKEKELRECAHSARGGILLTLRTRRARYPLAPLPLAATVLACAVPASSTDAEAQSFRLSRSRAASSAQSFASLSLADEAARLEHRAAHARPSRRREGRARRVGRLAAFLSQQHVCEGERPCAVTDGD